MQSVESQVNMYNTGMNLGPGPCASQEVYGGAMIKTLDFTSILFTSLLTDSMSLPKESRFGQIQSTRDSSVPMAVEVAVGASAAAEGSTLISRRLGGRCERDAAAMFSLVSSLTLFLTRCWRGG